MTHILFLQSFILPLIALAVGLGAGYGIYHIVLQKRGAAVLAKAEADGEVIMKEKILQAKEKFLQLKAENSQNFQEQRSKIQEHESRNKQKEQQLNQKQEELRRVESNTQRLQDELAQRLEMVEKKKQDLDKMHQRQLQQLETIAGLSAENAKAQLVEALQQDAKSEAMALVQDMVEEAKLNASKEAKRIIIQSIQRLGTETAVENAITVFNIESDDIKGRIIGREGRNIRALEAATGVEIIIDDTPEAIVLSCFDPVRREVARLALHQLVSDGRIHPARVEEVVIKVQRQLEEEILEIGKRTCIDLGVNGLHTDLMRHIGKMRYRSSYGQNLLQHSREVANLCAVMASELGLNPKLAKRAGLDMGSFFGVLDFGGYFWGDDFLIR